MPWKTPVGNKVKAKSITHDAWQNKIGVGRATGLVSFETNR